MKAYLTAALLATAMLATAKPDFTISLDPAAKPIKDQTNLSSAPGIGYAGTLADTFAGGDDWYFVSNRVELARAYRESGAWLIRMWSAEDWFARRNTTDPKKRRSNPEAAFSLWKEMGIKVLFTVEAWGTPDEETFPNKITEFVQWIVDNDYKDVVAGFELGNESYFAKPDSQRSLAKRWRYLIPQMLKIWPHAKLGIPIAEYFENDPDVAQIRARLQSSGEIKRDNYFSACEMNRNSAIFVEELKPVLKHITHVIYHGYGGETPYSGSYYGFQRFRNFVKAFPELEGKPFWLTEVRDRSDEDNRCQRLFRGALWKGHYFLTAVAQKDIDCFNVHQIYALGGGMYQSINGNWAVQWRDEGGEYKDYGAYGKRPRFDIGASGPVFKLYCEALKEHPVILEHGTSKEQGTEDTFFTSARVYDSFMACRKARKEGKTGRDLPKFTGEVEWLAAVNKNASQLCLLMVNTKNEPMTVKVDIKGKVAAAPTYRTVSCPEKFLDCREVPGDAKPWSMCSWEDSYANTDPLILEIGPNTVQTVTVALKPADWKPKQVW